MNSNETHKSTQSNSPNGGNGNETSKRHSYRLLGESGLVEDEKGNIYNASDIDDFDDSEQRPSPETIAAQLFPPSSGKPKHPDWAAIYDPRYCGPSREAYIDEMERRYNNDQSDITRKS